MERAVKLAILGANGLITESLLAAIGSHPSLSGEVTLLGSAESCETLVEFEQQTLEIQDIEGCGFDEIDILVATGESEVAGDWLRRALDAGCIVLDIGGHLAPQERAPVIVAAVNGGLLNDVSPGSVVVLPDAATTQAASLLHPLLTQLEIERVGLFSAQAVSERGRSGVEEMARQTAQMLNGKPARPVLFPRQVAFNLVPMTTDEVMGDVEAADLRIAGRLHQVLGEPDLPIMVSCCWAPVFYGISQAIQITVAGGVDLEAVKRILSQVPYIDAKWDSREIPTAVTDASGSDFLTVGGLTGKLKNTTHFSLWAVADNLRFGIAGNAVKIVELLVKRLFISYS
ncbi:MAG: Asd/ArgC dimerization domain-containing protein [Candidatus Thiodiazotropha sp.]